MLTRTLSGAVAALSAALTGSQASVQAVFGSGLDHQLAPPHAGRFPAWGTRLLSLVLLGLGLMVAGSAQAEIMSIPAVAFSQRCPCPIGEVGDPSEIDRGVLKTAGNNIILYAPVEFPTSQRVCGFALVYHDANNNDDMTARLLRKPFAVGGNPYAPPIPMATVVTSPGSSNLIRRVSTTTIGAAVINKTNTFYFVELTAPALNLNVIGVQIDVRATCP